MAKVEIYRLKKGGLQEVVVTCHLEGNEAICEGDTSLVERLNQDGLLDKSIKPPEKVYPRHGKRFLDILKEHFSSGYLIASEIQNSEPHL